MTVLKVCFYLIITGEDIYASPAIVSARVKCAIIYIELLSLENICAINKIDEAVERKVSGSGRTHI